jgi:Mn2+/Fe2+ NRAMP family transporter
MRAVLFAAMVGVGFLAGLRGFLLLIVALLASGVASWFLLAGPRARVSAAVDSRVQRSRERTAAEDQYVDSLMADPGVTQSDR